MIEQRIRARVGAYSVPAVVHAVQGDTGRVFVFELEDYTVTGAEGASLNCQRPDKSFYTYAGTVSAEDNTVTVALDVEGGALTQEGVVTFQLELTEAGLIVCTFRGSIIVEPVVGGEATQEEKDFRDAIQAQLNDKASNAQLAQVASDLTDSIDGVADDLAQEILDRESADATKADKSTKINGKSLEADRVIYAQDVPSKNLLPNTASTQTVNGVTFTVNADGSISTSGTASAGVEFFIYANGYWSPSPYPFDKSNQYILSGCPTGGTDSSYSIRIYEYNGSSSTGNYKDYGSGVTFTPNASGTGCLVMIAIQSGQNMNGKTFRPMIRLASITDDTYVPYAMTNAELSQGSSGSNYTKLADGTLMQWGKKSVSGNTSQTGSLYLSTFGSTGSPLIAFPIPFLDDNIGLSVTVGAGGYNFPVYINYTNTHIVQVELARPNATTINADIQWLAIGRWK